MKHVRDLRHVVFAFPDQPSGFFDLQGIIIAHDAVFPVQGKQLLDRVFALSGVPCHIPNGNFAVHIVVKIIQDFLNLVWHIHTVNDIALPRFLGEDIRVSAKTD